jgi:hypothetical protein
MEEILKLIENYEEANDRSCIELSIFSDGSGTLNEYGIEFYEFKRLEDLILFLKQ